jgi:hypothetical protein
MQNFKNQSTAKYLKSLFCGAHGIVVVEGLHYKPEFAGSRPDKVIEFYQST